MEPCLFRHGKVSLREPRDSHSSASMEPCLFRHGKREIAMVKEILEGGFNGAMSFQTW